MLFFNQLMFKFLFNSLELNGATVTSTINFIFNNCLNALSGYIFFKESVNI